jgi:hypothetical protein
MIPVKIYGIFFELMILFLFLDKHIQYVWLQTTDDITVWLQIPEQTSKSDLNVTVDTNYVKIKCKDFVLLEGSTWHCLESQLTMWALNKGK